MVTDDKKETVSQISDEALDDLLSRWAEAEIEPPAGFHARTMERLRHEQHEKESITRGKKVVPFFLQNKKWMSAAAAAVLVLFCIPVVQAQFSDHKTEPIYDRPSKQAQTVLEGTTAEKEENSTEELNKQQETNQASANTTAEQQPEKQTVPKESKKIQDSKVNVKKNEVNTNDGSKTQSSVSSNQGLTENAGTENPAEQGAVTQTPNAQVPGAVYYSIDDKGVGMAVGAENQGLPQNNSRSVDGNPEKNVADVSSYQTSLEELTAKLQTLEKELDENKANLEKSPEDQALIDKIDDLQKEIDLLKKEIEQLKNLVAEATEEPKSE